jgi:hypothetical protein
MNRSQIILTPLLHAIVLQAGERAELGTGEVLRGDSREGGSGAVGDPCQAFHHHGHIGMDTSADGMTVTGAGEGTRGCAESATSGAAGSGVPAPCRADS